MFTPKTTQEAVALRNIERAFAKEAVFPTFQEFGRIVVEEYGAHILAASLPPENFTATMQLLYVIYIARNAGFPTFVVEPDLAKMLCATDLPKDISVAQVRLPFEGIIIDVPGGTFSAPADKVARVYVIHVPNDRFRIVFMPDNETTTYVSLDGWEEESQKSILEVIEDTKNKYFLGMPPELVERYKKTWLYDDYYKSDVFTFVLNTILYITSDGADVEEDKRRIHEIHQKLQGLKSKNKRQILEKQLKEEKMHRVYSLWEASARATGIFRSDD